MKKIKLAILTLLLLLTPLTVTAQPYLKDPIITSKDAIWVDLRSYTSLSAAITDIGATETELYISESTALTANVTIPANVRLKFKKGAVITLGAFNLTINGDNFEYDFEHFDNTGVGTLSFSQGISARVRTEAQLDAAIAASAKLIVVADDITLTGDHDLSASGSAIDFVPDAVITTNGNALTLGNQIPLHHRQQLFSGSGVVFTVPVTVMPQWWYSGSGVYNTALTYARAAFGTNTVSGTVFFPGNTTYTLNDTFTIASGTYGSNITWRGEDWTALIKKTVAAKNAFKCDSGAPNVFIDNIVIENLAFEGLSVDIGFSEHAHILNLSGITNSTIRRCKFTEFEGDGIYIGSGVSVERHNKNVTIEHNFFDGVNNTCRNAITVIDGDGVYIEHNKIINASYNPMPGPICIEPNNNAYHIVKDIHIYKNHIEITTLSANYAINVRSKPLVTAGNMHGIFIRDNFIRGQGSGYGRAFYINQNVTIDSSSPWMNVVVENNDIHNIDHPFYVPAARGVKFINNTWRNCNFAGILGAVPVAVGVRDVEFIDNDFISCERLWVVIGNKVKFKGNSFIGGTDADALLFYAGGNSSYVALEDNYFEKGAGSMTNAIQIDAGHTLSYMTNKVTGNRLNADLTETTCFLKSLLADAATIISGAAYTPSKWPLGETTMNVTADAGAPDTAKTGQLITRKPAQWVSTSSARRYITQTYIAADKEEGAMWFRRGLSTGTDDVWGDWVQVDTVVP